DEAFAQLKQHPYLKLKGVHSHIGSQIFNSKSFVMAVQVLFDKIKEWKQSFQFIPELMNFGGGFGIRYTKEDDLLPNDYHVKDIVRTVKVQVNDIDIQMHDIWFETRMYIVDNA